MLFARLAPAAEDRLSQCPYFHQRIKSLGIGEVSQIMYVNVHMPYYYFDVIDPDGNILEVTGHYEGDDTIWD